MFSATCRLCNVYGIQWINRKTQICEEINNFLYLKLRFRQVAGLIPDDVIGIFQ